MKKGNKEKKTFKLFYDWFRVNWYTLKYVALLALMQPIFAVLLHEPLNVPLWELTLQKLKSYRLVPI